MKTYCLELTGDFACFTHPEMKVERVSYDVMTPSAARACFEAILWKPAIRWHIRKIEVLKPIRWINLRRNEVASVVSTRNVETAMKNGTGILGLNIEDDRQQRAGLFLRDVAYRVHADLEVLPNAAPDNTPMKFQEMFERRASLGALLGSTLIWGIVYLSGLVLEKIGVQLYHSESDQQRNFNIVIAIWMIFAIVGGWLGYKMGKKSRAP